MKRRPTTKAGGASRRASRPIGEAWDAFVQLVMSPVAGDVQKREMRRAFYAGAWAVMCVVERVSRDDVPAADGEAMLGRVDDEIRAFQRTVGSPAEGEST